MSKTQCKELDLERLMVIKLILNGKGRKKDRMQPDLEKFFVLPFLLNYPTLQLFC